jgi:hypothetical protein
MLFSVEGTGKNQLEPDVGNAQVFSHLSLHINHGPKPVGVLVHCRDEKTNIWFSIFRSVCL